MGLQLELNLLLVVSFNSAAFRASNVSHTVVLRPLKAGYFNFTSASVSYLAQEGGQVVVRAAGLFLSQITSLQLHVYSGVNQTELFVRPAGRLHQRSRPGRHPGSEGVRPPLLPTLCKCSISQVVEQNLYNLFFIMY